MHFLHLVVLLVIITIHFSKGLRRRILLTPQKLCVLCQAQLPPECNFVFFCFLDRKWHHKFYLCFIWTLTEPHR